MMPESSLAQAKVYGPLPSVSLLGAVRPWPLYTRSPPIFHHLMPVSVSFHICVNFCSWDYLLGESTRDFGLQEGSVFPRGDVVHSRSSFYSPSFGLISAVILLLFRWLGALR